MRAKQGLTRFVGANFLTVVPCVTTDRQKQLPHRNREFGSTDHAIITVNIILLLMAVLVHSSALHHNNSVDVFKHTSTLIPKLHTKQCCCFPWVGNFENTTPPLCLVADMVPFSSVEAGNSRIK